MTRYHVSLIILSLFLSIASMAQVKDVSVKSANKKLNKGITTIDVRTTSEFEAGHLNRSLHYDIQDTARFLQQIQHLDRNKPYLLYCRSGKRSTAAAAVMARQGFTRLYNMKGGYMAWEAEMQKEK
jgi:phage shock protein E